MQSVHGALLPFEPLELLAQRSRRLADLVESISRRKDVRELRSRLLVVLLELRCPPGVRPRRSWYVPGAVARLGIEGIRRAWRGLLGLEPPCPRSLRAHLGILEKARALVRSPGDRLEGAPEGRAWRHADTIHLLEDEEALLDWLAVAPSVEARRDARRDPRLWGRLAGKWRGGRPRQLELAFPAAAGAELASRPPAGLPDRVGADTASGGALRRALGAVVATVDHDALDALRVLEAHGARVRGRPSFQLAADLGRLEGAGALLALALSRGDSIRNRAAWLVRAHRHAAPGELRAARAWLLGYDRAGGPSP